MEFYSFTVTPASKIVALHLAYEMSKPQILWFGQLVSHSPSILWKLQDNIPQREFPEMVIICGTDDNLFITMQISATHRNSICMLLRK